MRFRKLFNPKWGLIPRSLLRGISFMTIEDSRSVDSIVEYKAELL